MQEKKTMTLNLSEAEMQTLDELSVKKDLSKTAVLRQALRLYQTIEARLDLGHKLFIEDSAHESGIAEIALDAGQPGKRVLIELQIDVDDGVSFAQQAAFQHASKEARTPGDQDMSHGFTLPALNRVPQTGDKID